MNPIRPTKPMKEGRIYLDSLIFGSFWLDPTMRWKFSLKSRLEVVVFVLIPWLSHRSNKKWTDSAKIQQRFGEDLVVETHSDFDEPNHYPSETDSTQPEVVCSWRRFIQPSTQCERVGFRLGTNPTQTNPWTPLFGPIQNATLMLSEYL